MYLWNSAKAYNDGFYIRLYLFLNIREIITSRLLPFFVAIILINPNFEPVNMSAVMDMSLDDIIKNNKKSGFGSSRGRIRPFGYGPTHRFPNRAANRAAPYATAKVPFTFIYCLVFNFDAFDFRFLTLILHWIWLIIDFRRQRWRGNMIYMQINMWLRRGTLLKVVVRLP